MSLGSRRFPTRSKGDKAADLIMVLVAFITALACHELGHHILEYACFTAGVMIALVMLEVL